MFNVFELYINKSESLFNVFKLIFNVTELHTDVFEPIFNISELHIIYLSFNYVSDIFQRDLYNWKFMRNRLLFHIKIMRFM